MTLAPAEAERNTRTAAGDRRVRSERNDSNITGGWDVDRYMVYLNLIQF